VKKGKQPTLGDVTFYAVFATLLFAWWVGYKQPYLWVPYLIGNWCSYQGKVETIDVSFVAAVGSGGGTNFSGAGRGYLPKVTYQFVANGTNHIGNQYQLPPVYYSEKSAAIRELGGLEVGALVAVRARCETPHADAYVQFARGYYIVTTFLLLLPSLCAAAAAFIHYSKFKNRTR
jgi:hypothetical protein